METKHRIFDRLLLARRRDRFAALADRADFLERHAADDIVERLSFIKRRFPIAAVVGTGSGILERALPRADIGSDLLVSTDLSAGRLAAAPGLQVLADEELLPFRDASLDLVVSTLSLQLVNDLPGALIQIRRALKPDGLFIGALLGGMSLVELREALVVAETETLGGASPRVAPFADVRDLGALLQRAGFALPVADSDTLEVGYASPMALMVDLKSMGWSNMLVDRSRLPMRRSTLARAAEIYQERHVRPDGRVKATFEIVTLTGWAPHESQQKPLRPGSASSRLADALGTHERPAGDEPSGT